MVGWMCGVGLQDGVPSGGLRDRLGLDDMVSVLHDAMVWACVAGIDSGWVRRCVECEVGFQAGSGPGRTWREIVERDCRAHGLNREDAMDRVGLMRQIGDD